MGCGASDENHKATNNPTSLSQVSGNNVNQDKTSEGFQHSPMNRDTIQNQSVATSHLNNPLNSTTPGNNHQYNTIKTSQGKDLEDEEAIVEQPGRQHKRKNSTELKEKEFERSKLKESDYEPAKPNLEPNSAAQLKGLQILDKPPLSRPTLKPLNINATRLENSSSFAPPNLKQDSTKLQINKASPKANSGGRFLPPIRRDPIRFEPVPQGFDFDLGMENERVFSNKKLDTKQLVDELLRDMEEL